NAREIAILVPLAIAVIGIGVAPGAVMKTMLAPVQMLRQPIAYVPAPDEQPAAAAPGGRGGATPGGGRGGAGGGRGGLGGGRGGAGGGRGGRGGRGAATQQAPASGGAPAAPIAPAQQ